MPTRDRLVASVVAAVTVSAALGLSHAVDAEPPAPVAASAAPAAPAAPAGPAAPEVGDLTDRVVVLDDGYRTVTEPRVKVRRSPAETLAVRAQLDAAVAAGAPHNGGFGTGFDETGALMLSIPVLDVSEGQRALGDRLNREFGGIVTIWRGGSGGRWTSD